MCRHDDIRGGRSEGRSQGGYEERREGRGQVMTILCSHWLMLSNTVFSLAGGDPWWEGGMMITVLTLWTLVEALANRLVLDSATSGSQYCLNHGQLIWDNPLTGSCRENLLYPRGNQESPALECATWRRSKLWKLQEEIEQMKVQQQWDEMFVPDGIMHYKLCFTLKQLGHPFRIFIGIHTYVHIYPIFQLFWASATSLKRSMM